MPKLEETGFFLLLEASVRTPEVSFVSEVSFSLCVVHFEVASRSVAQAGLLFTLCESRACSYVRIWFFMPARVEEE